VAVKVSSQRQLLHRRFAAQCQQLRQVREWVRDTALANGMSEQRAERVVIGVNEACMNIITHAYAGTSGEIELDIRQADAMLIFTLTDFAKTVDCSTIKSRDLDDIRPGGLGVHFIHEVMDDVSYLPGANGVGNLIVMKVRIKDERMGE
jgi:anti-sigma regulatory factor (Ser/Thr protein kinase)